jgi:hypothetical protein
VGFFLNVTKHDELSFTKFFHSHSGTLDIVLNQNYSASEWSSEGKLEPFQGGLESDNDHFVHSKNLSLVEVTFCFLLDWYMLYIT